MSYTFKRSESVEQGIRRVAREQLQVAIKNLQGDSARRLEGVHESRKCLKKLRALIGLAQPGKDGWKEAAEQCFKTAAKGLAPLRDADSLHQVCQSLQDKHQPELGSEVFEMARKVLTIHRGSLDSGTEKLQNELSEILAQLQRQHAAIDDWDLSETSPKTMFSNIERRYGHGRDMIKFAEDNRSIDIMHSWRKCCKDHWYHIRLLKKIWPEIMQARAAACSKLCDLLGDDHDLALLREILSLHQSEMNDAGQLTPLLELIERQQSKVQAEAFELGHLMFTEKKRELKHRLSRYWKIWKSVKKEKDQE